MADYIVATVSADRAQVFDNKSQHTKIGHLEKGVSVRIVWNDSEDTEVVNDWRLGDGAASCWMNTRDLALPTEPLPPPPTTVQPANATITLSDGSAWRSDGPWVQV
jgi:hypothetical protein